MRLTVIGLSALLTCGCQLQRDVDSTVTPDGVALTVEQPTDLPVPQELRLRSGVHQSHVYQSGSFRSVFLKYEGKQSVETLHTFLRDRLPIHGWEFVQEERPTQDRIVQRWIGRSLPQVRYRLVVEVTQGSDDTELTYDLRTERTSSGVPLRSESQPATPQKPVPQK